MDLEEKADEIEYSIDGIVEVNYKDPLYEDNSRLNYPQWIERTDQVKAV